jgi:branched-chain amino acid transport system substrate-binding protein
MNACYAGPRATTAPTPIAAGPSLLLGGLRIASVCILGTLVMAGCRWPSQGLPVAPRDVPVLIGVPLPLSGAKAAFGELKRNAFAMAAEEINAAGGVDGRPLVLIFRDTAGDPSAAAAAAEDLISRDRVVLLAGEYSSGCARAVAEVAQDHAVPYLIDSAAIDDLTQQKWPYVFRLNPPASLYAQGLTALLAELVRPSSMAIVYERSDFGAALAGSMRTWCRREEVRLSVFAAYEVGTLDFSPILSEIAEADPDVVYMVSYLIDATLLLRQARDRGLRPRLWAGGAAGFVLPELVAAAAEDAENVVTVSLWAPSLGFPGATDFSEAYRSRFGVYPSYHAAASYACVYVIADAVRRAASTSPERIRAALLDADLQTAFGPVRFESFGRFQNQNRPGAIVLQIIRGKFEVVWPPDWATAELVVPK